MSYISFDKLALINLEYSLNKEFLRSNRGGSFSSTTIIGCNTRKYHGLLVTPQPLIDNDNHVLLSSFDETVIQMEAEFNLGIHKYPGAHYNPKGHKYIKELSSDSIPRIVYRVGGVVLSKELLLAHEDHRILLKYTLLEAHSPTKIRFKPFLAFRNVHSLSKANLYVNKHYEPIQNGASFRMYNGYTPLLIQFSKAVEYTHVPDWYYDIEYLEEINRGYEGCEDLYVPGFFELDIEKGESIIVSAGLDELTPNTLVRRFNKELKIRVPRNSFHNCLINSAQQFIKKKGKKIEIIAGFPWYDRRGRDVFMSLPGLTLTQNDPKLCKHIIDSMIAEFDNGLFPHIGYMNKVVCTSPDVSLWFFWTLQEYAEHTRSKGQIWREYKNTILTILENFRDGCLHNVKMLENNLLYVKEHGCALTWMDAYHDGKPILPRYGSTVECNALWYNAVCFALEVAELANDTIFVDNWSTVRDGIKKSFNEVFSDADLKHLADSVDNDVKDWSIRPNQIIAISLPHSPLNEDKKMDIIEVVKKELLTSRGLRTLSPQDVEYKGTYEGNVEQREAAAFNGSVYPWLLAHYAHALYNVYGSGMYETISELITQFEDVMWEHGIGSVSEFYDGDPPHKAGGAISFATSVAEILRIMSLLENIKNK